MESLVSHELCDEAKLIERAAFTLVLADSSLIQQPSGKVKLVPTSGTREDSCKMKAEKG